MIFLSENIGFRFSLIIASGNNVVKSMTCVVAIYRLLHSAVLVFIVLCLNSRM